MARPITSTKNAQPKTRARTMITTPASTIPIAPMNIRNIQTSYY